MNRKLIVAALISVVLVISIAACILGEMFPAKPPTSAQLEAALDIPRALQGMKDLLSLLFWGIVLYGICRGFGWLSRHHPLLAWCLLVVLGRRHRHYY